MHHHIHNLDVPPSPIDNNRIPAASFSELQFFTTVEGMGLIVREPAVGNPPSDLGVGNIMFTSCSCYSQSPDAAPPSFSSEDTDWSSQILTWGKKNMTERDFLFPQRPFFSLSLSGRDIQINTSSTPPDGFFFSRLLALIPDTELIRSSFCLRRPVVLISGCHKPAPLSLLQKSLCFGRERTPARVLCIE